MEINLLYKNQIKRDLEKRTFKESIVKDLKLELVLKAMSQGDAYLYDVCEEILTQPLIEEEEILWRQAVVKEVIKGTKFFKQIYEMVSKILEEVEQYKAYTTPKYYKIIKNSKKIITEVSLLEIFMKLFKEIKVILKEKQFIEAPMVQFANEFKEKFNDAFIEKVDGYIEALKCIKERQDMTLTGHVFLGFKRADYGLNSLDQLEDTREDEKGKRFWNKLFKEKGSSQYHIFLDELELQNEVETLIETTCEGIFKALSQYNRQLIKMLQEIKYQFGFYSCCGQLYSEMTQLQVPCCFPKFIKSENNFYSKSLMDIGLVIKNKKAAVGNNLEIKDKKLWIITGANQGGKTTFLRSLGLGLIMAQSGLFVSAKVFKTKIFKGIFTFIVQGEKKMANVISCFKRGSLALLAMA